MKDFEEVGISNEIWTRNAKTTRLKDDVIEEAENYGDYGFRFTQEQAQKVCGDTRFRLVQWHDLENDRWFEFLSNDFDLTAQQIADLYRKRWQIELFFKKLKQNLKIKSFIGTSENKCRDDSDLDSSRGYAVNWDITAHCAVSLEFFQITEICEIKSFDVQKIGCVD